MDMFELTEARQTAVIRAYHQGYIEIGKPEYWKCNKRTAEWLVEHGWFVVDNRPNGLLRFKLTSEAERAYDEYRIRLQARKHN